MDYKTLYLKYKYKYLKLKKSIGGGLFYEEDSKNIHQILKNVFENETFCNKIKSKIYNILDPSMKITLKISFSLKAKMSFKMIMVYFMVMVIKLCNGNII
jgi:hypothetical protein